jgi:UDP:flavonoid glycosyltransferase YjiC (YdhE family)
MFDGAQEEDLDPELLEFCRAGTPPVAFTFGTGMAHPAELFRAALKACTALGIRGIFLTKHKEELPEPLPASVIHRGFAPFRKLFPQCAAVVHHGGIGTVAKAMAAGAPQLICPICFDQLDNGVRTKALGAGDWLKFRPGDGSQIADALTSLMTPETRLHCRRISARFEDSDALESTAQIIERFATRGRGRGQNNFFQVPR